MYMYDTMNHRSDVLSLPVSSVGRGIRLLRIGSSAADSSLFPSTLAAAPADAESAFEPSCSFPNSIESDCVRKLWCLTITPWTRWTTLKCPHHVYHSRDIDALKTVTHILKLILERRSILVQLQRCLDRWNPWWRWLLLESSRRY